MSDMVFYFEHFDSPYPYDVSCSILSNIDVNVLDYTNKKHKAQQKGQMKVKKGR